jgi:hypothetical protein
MLVIRRLGLAALAVASALALCASAAAGAAGPGGWRVAAPGRFAYLQSVAAGGKDDVWSAGATVARGGRAGRLLIERWSGQSWRPVAVPGPLVGKFQSGEAGQQTFPLVKASSADNVWIFNEATGAFLRWNGRGWSVGSVVAHRRGQVVGVTSALVLGKAVVWAFGATINAKGDALPLAAHFGGAAGMWCRCLTR